MLESAKKGVAIRKRSKKGGVSTRGANLAAIRDLFDPQGFTDRLFALLSERRTNERHGTRLLHIALCARVIGVHRLQTLGFYSYLQRFLQPKQRDVTRVYIKMYLFYLFIKIKLSHSNYDTFSAYL
jgi:protein SDA1